MAPAPGGSSDPQVEELVQALVDGDRSRGERLFQAHLEETDSFLATIDELVQPAMAEIGARWEHGELSVAEEHLATATAETIVARQLPGLGGGLDREGSILLACVEDNEHELGLRVLADAYELVGWETRCLGADVPTTALTDMVDDWRPDVVALSVSMELHVPVAREAVERIRALGEPQPRILLGGPLRGGSEELLEEVAADGWATSIQQGIEAAKT